MVVLVSNLNFTRSLSISFLELLSPNHITRWRGMPLVAADVFVHVVVIDADILNANCCRCHPLGRVHHAVYQSSKYVVSLCLGRIIRITVTSVYR